MKLVIKGFLVVTLTIGMLTGCSKVDSGLAETEKMSYEQTIQNQSDTISELQKKLEENSPNVADAITPLDQANRVIQLIAKEDMTGLSAYVHPTKGLRFTPYAYVDVNLDLVFTKDQVPELMMDPKLHVWGSFDGSGEEMSLTFAEYFNTFVYNVDFANPNLIGNNVSLGGGNTQNNLSEAYPEGSFVDFHFDGFDDQYEGLDWCGLRLVFENVSGVWYLVGIIHDQWTI